MEQITIAQWQQWKEEIRGRLNQTVENFIAIGSRMRQIKETEAFRNDGFESVTDWAKAEFNLAESTVTRFMAISEKFTIEGAGQELLPDFKGMSYSKLQEMLTLSDEDCRLITVNTTVKEIREFKQFNHDDENKYRTQTERTPLQECIWDFFSNPGNKGLLEEVIAGITAPDYSEASASIIADAISPSGTRTHRKGIVFLFMYDADRGISYKLMTSPVPAKMTWYQFLEEVRVTYADYLAFGDKVWEAAYGSVDSTETEPQIPGQMDISQLEPVGDEPVKEEVAAEQKEEEKKEQIATSQPIENITAQTEIVEKEKEPEFETAINPPEEPEMVEEKESETISKEINWEELWNSFLDGADELDKFGTKYVTDEIAEIPKEELEKAYKTAIEVAAALEEMLNGKKYSSQ